jgi:hypothetical protein
VLIQHRSLRTLRLSSTVLRSALIAAAGAGIAATARYSLAPPPARVTLAQSTGVAAARGPWFADEFAGAYLAWGGATHTPDAALAPFVAAGAAAGTGGPTQWPAAQRVSDQRASSYASGADK